MRGGWRSYVELSRPFTLLAPAAGMVSAGIAGLGAAPAGGHRPGPAVLRLALGAMLAVFLNAASNALNQVCDLEIDRINKPARPLPSGRVGVQSAGLFAGVLFLTALALAAGPATRSCIAAEAFEQAAELRDRLKHMDCLDGTE